MHQVFLQLKICAPRTVKIAKFCVADTKLVGDRLHQLWYEKIQIGIALPMRMRRQIDRHAINTCGKIGTVIEIESAHKHLVRFTVTTVLRENHAWHGLEQLPFAR